MPNYKLNWIKKIQVKSSKNASNKMGQNLSRKTAAEKHIFLPYLNMSKKSEKNSSLHRMKSCIYSSNISSLGFTE